MLLDFFPLILTNIVFTDGNNIYELTGEKIQLRFKHGFLNINKWLALTFEGKGIDYEMLFYNDITNIAAFKIPI